jgi:hypothetical protein
MANRTLNLDDSLYQYILDHSLREHRRRPPCARRPAGIDTP